MNFHILFSNLEIRVRNKKLQREKGVRKMSSDSTFNCFGPVKLLRNGVWVEWSAFSEEEKNQILDDWMKESFQPREVPKPPHADDSHDSDD